MKNLNRFTVLLLLALVVVPLSCTDLTETPYNEVTEDNFNPTQKDIPRLIAPVYTGLRWYMACCYDYISMQEGAADDYITPSRPNGWGGPYLPWHYHLWTPVHDHVTTAWNNFFDGINSANRVLYQIENVIDVSEDIKPGLVAEIRAVRAYYYYQLMDNFGNVPIVTDFTSEDLPVQSTRQEVYDFVVKELTESIPDLTVTVDQTTYGRMTKWAAEATLARVYLNAEIYTGTAHWNDVITLTDDIISNGPFQLEASYRSNFTRTNDTSKEVVWAIPYDEVYASGNTMHMRTLAPEQQQSFQMAAQPWGGSAATPQFINTYDEEDVRLEDTWSGGPQVTSSGDTVITFSKDVPSMEATEFSDGYRVNKYEIYPGMTASSDVDLPLFRYSMVLMMKAEALLRTSQPDAAATIVTQVRQRDFPDDPAKVPVTGAELMQGSDFNYGYWENGQVVNAEGGGDILYGRFLDELGWEFAVEGFRRQDMIRFGVFIRKSWFNKRASQDDPCRIIFPIPNSAIETNSNLQQNSCYE